MANFTDSPPGSGGGGGGSGSGFDIPADGDAAVLAGPIATVSGVDIAFVAYDVGTAILVYYMMVGTPSASGEIVLADNMPFELNDTYFFVGPELDISKPSLGFWDFGGGDNANLFLETVGGVSRLVLDYNAAAGAHSIETGYMFGGIFAKAP